MPYITSKGTLDQEVKIFYQDAGSGKPVVLIHGWPLGSTMWEYQINDLVAAGYRVIAYDRRGFGKSDRPWRGYDYNTLAADLKALLDELKLTDVALVGFSMGGGEIARYLGNYGSAGISKVALIGAVTPFLLKTDDNPDGVPAEVFAEIKTNIQNDRPSFLQTFSKQFYGMGLLSKPVSQGILDYDFSVAVAASPKATFDCVTAFAETDFRADIASITLPILVIHGGADKTVPIEASGNRTAQMLPHCEYIIYEGEPHGLFITSRERLSEDLISFLG